MRVLRSLFLPLTLALLLSVTVATPSQAGGLPSRAKWNADVARAMSGSWVYVNRRASGHRKPLAINLDIDNTSLATKYGGGPVRSVLRFARHAHSLGVAIFFNTGRTGAPLHNARRQLRRAGYPVSGVCGLRSRRVTLVQSKKRCRIRVVDAGYRIIANGGNSGTDFVGGNYDRAFRLPNYGGRLK